MTALKGNRGNSGRGAILGLEVFFGGGGGGDVGVWEGPKGYKTRGKLTLPKKGKERTLFLLKV